MQSISPNALDLSVRHAALIYQSHLSAKPRCGFGILRWTPMLGKVNNRQMAIFLREFTRIYFVHLMKGGPRPVVPQDFAEVRWKE